MANTIDLPDFPLPDYEGLNKAFRQVYDSYYKTLESIGKECDAQLIEIIQRLEALGIDAEEEKKEYGKELLGSLIKQISEGITKPVPSWKTASPSTIKEVVNTLKVLPESLILDLLSHLGTTPVIKEELKDAVIAGSVEDFKRILYENHIDSTRLSKVIDSFHIEGVDPADVILPFLREGRIGAPPKNDLDDIAAYLKYYRNWISPKEKNTIIIVINKPDFPADYRGTITEAITGNSPGITKDPKQSDTGANDEDRLLLHLPTGDEWFKCGFFSSKDNYNYKTTTLGAARLITQKQIEDLFLVLVNSGCIDSTKENLYTLAIRLTGRKLMSEPIPAIEWIGEEAEIDYFIFRLTPSEQSPEYSRYKHFFKDYDPSGAGRRVATGKVRQEMISLLDTVLPTKNRPKI